jgi:uncharacterized protein YxeA
MLHRLKCISDTYQDLYRLKIRKDYTIFMQKTAKTGSNRRKKMRLFTLFSLFHEKGKKKRIFYQKSSHVSIDLYHKLQLKENGVTQLLDVVPDGLHGPDPHDVHGELGHRAHDQLPQPLIFSHQSRP